VTNTFTPLADEKAVATDLLGATTDGNHILGAHANGAASTLTDLAVTSLNTATACPVAGAAQVAPGYFNTTLYAPKTLTGINATNITGVLPSSNSAVAFVTYNGSSGKLPLYVPSTSTLSLLTLGNGATTASAPVSGVFSTDNLNFYTGTSGDDQVHIFSISGTTATEKSVITPKLPDANGNPVQINLLAQRPKKLTN